LIYIIQVQRLHTPLGAPLICISFDEVSTDHIREKSAKLKISTITDSMGTFGNANSFLFTYIDNKFPFLDHWHVWK